jgi:23S rRNA (cytidine1920-2'-O)/16S rRNA (cytidine1409-2'-O)-methyltransferase
VKRKRADALLVERGLAPDLARARALILAGEVVAGDRRVDKAGEALPADAPLRLKERAHPYVSRGGVKLAHALDHFRLDPAGRIALDLGASTGGFTDVLLRRGARRVYAVDVGYGQLAWSLRGDPRVVVLERTHAKDLDAALVPEPVEVLVSDVSFTSLVRVLPPVLPLLAPGAVAVLLVKPQFEAAPGEVEAGGVVRDAATRARVAAEVAADVERLGFAARGLVESPLPGAEGNVEYLLAADWPIRPRGPAPP